MVVPLLPFYILFYDKLRHQQRFEFNLLIFSRNYTVNNYDLLKNNLRLKNGKIKRYRDSAKKLGILIEKELFI